MNTLLTLEEVEDVLANSRTRGDYLPYLKTFFNSGTLATDCTEAFPGKHAASLRNSIEQNCKKVEDAPSYKVMLMGTDAEKHVIVINMDVLAAEKAAQEATEAPVL